MDTIRGYHLFSGFRVVSKFAYVCRNFSIACKQRLSMQFLLKLANDKIPFCQPAKLLT